MLVQFSLPADSMLICDNLRVLHGRTAFADSRRSLVRIRLVQR
jgi:alpha-ketoglutarate-dependent taurine dioxygenase